MRAEPVHRVPLELRAWIAYTWTSERPDIVAPHAREHSLPTGAMHLVVRLDGPPLRIYADADDRIGTAFASATVGGARAGYCIKDTAHPAASVGAVLRPGAALALLGVSAAELEGRHVSLRDLWGEDAERLYQRLAATEGAQARQALFERALTERLRPARALHPQLVWALRCFERGAVEVGDIARADGRSHRHFIAAFHEAAGLTPKRYARVLRFKRLLAALAATPRPEWARLALEAGYCDQSHLIREFREFAGVTPSEYSAAGPHQMHHLPVR